MTWSLAGRVRVTSLKAAGALAYGQDMAFVPEQEAITRSKLIPAMPAILERLKVYRETVDRGCAEHRQKVEANGGQTGFGLQLSAYPIGFCRIIRDAVWDLALADPAFLALLGHGVILRRVFILLKGQYFQNAVQMGNLYVDVANDTVWVNKPKLEWANVEAVDYRNVETWAYFAEVAQRYLKVALYPNRLFPLAFPIAPFFAIRPTGRIELLFAQDALFLKDLGEGMPRLQALLTDETWMGRRLPPAYEKLLHTTFGGGGVEAFPLKFAAVANEALREGVVAEFVALGREAPERAIGTVDRYMKIMLHALRRMTLLNLVPEPAELEQLRREGLIPASS